MSNVHMKNICVPHMDGCQNYGPFLGTLNMSCRLMIEIQKGTIILTTSHVGFRVSSLEVHGNT